MTGQPRRRRGRGKAKRRASCEGKVQYPSQAAAVEVADRLRRTKGLRLWAYKCQFCRVTDAGGNQRAGWHLGHLPRGTRPPCLAGS